mmetsp:Transcript_14001/g.26210  ORF Transcript_14001/g.26210 Transcript_14001/m.26210 type:complete len:225 (-) Transcript_14001:96-770(-)
MSNTVTANPPPGNIAVIGTTSPKLSLHSRIKAKSSQPTMKKSGESCNRTPKDVLQSMLANVKGDCHRPKKFERPPEEDIAAYDVESVQAIRSNNLEKLRQMWLNGKRFDACNPSGESLIHMACRRGDLKVVSFLVCEVKVRTERCDDFGRNPFHDALWTSSPNMDVLDLLIDHADPTMLLAEDVRGSTPFDYARREHHAKWVEYLEQRKEKLQKHPKLAPIAES